MKKIFAIVLTFAMLLSLGAVAASALTSDEIPGVSFAPGGYSGEAEDFSSLGTVKITWDAKAGEKLDLSDGDMADWAAAGYNMVTLDVNNMIYWVKDGAGVPAGWQIQTYFVADADYLYIGFYVTDPSHKTGVSGNYQSGDSFQVCIDFGGLMSKTLATDPDVLSNPKNIFYSFCNIGGEGTPIEIMRQESDNNMWLTEANGDGVKGTTKTTETGWCAEFAMSWQMMYDDYVWKAWAEDPKVYVGSDQHLPLNVGCCLYYLDRSADSDTLNWAAGSTNGITNSDGTPMVSWSAYDNGINLELDWTEDITFNCTGIVVMPLTETTPEETEKPTEEETTAAPTEAPTETEAPSEEATTEAPTEAPTETEAPAGGCGSVIGFSAIAVLAAAAAAVALKKD